MNHRSSSQPVPLPAVLLLVAAAFVLGLVTDFGSSWAEAAPQKKLTLGITAEKAISIMGAPEKISYDADIQTWYYRTGGKQVIKRCIVNQGLVVRIF